MSLTPPPFDYIQQQVLHSLQEDIGSGDVTARLIPENAQAHATIVCREVAVICGAPWVNEVFAQLDPTIHINWQVKDGDQVQAQTQLCSLQGPARVLLTGERSALNFLQTLSATASQTRHYVDALTGSHCRVLDTRKTLPALRLAQKYAVRCGGGNNHRNGLYDMVLIKENHLHAAGSIQAAVSSARQTAEGLPIEVEVESLDELRQALAQNVDRILLDNMDIATLKQAVAIAEGKIALEASGGIDLQSAKRIAQTGVDFISVGAITKHIHAIDLSMRFQPN